MKNNNFFTALKMLLVLTFLSGVLYPLFITLLAGLIFPVKSTGSLITDKNKVVGSLLIGQKFESSRYFHSRPSSCDYNPLSSGASNLGPISNSLKTIINQRKVDYVTSNFLNDDTKIPNDAICSSASGLDPHISPQNAFMQIDRVAKARGFNPKMKSKLLELVNSKTEQRQFGFLGEPVINVLLLNATLDNLNFEK
jgi:potassium-transporting ATPase KdpC subunit